VPGSRNVVPGSRNVVPGTRNVVPGSRNVVPDTRNVVPDSRNVVPDTRNVVPGSRNIVPSTRHAEPSTSRDRRSTVPGLAAVVLAESPLARVRVAGLRASERAVRVARRVGATEIVVVTAPADRAAITAITSDVLVIRADQLVHTPLAAPIVATGTTAVAVDDADAYAGAFVARGDAAIAAVAALAGGAADTDVATALAAPTRVACTGVARHSLATPADRRAAHRLLYTILVKAQDNAITRYLYRPVSFPLTRALAWTPITPNQISIAVAALVALGCWLTAHASNLLAFAGTAVVLAAGYLDCCDGEIARVKLLSSRIGAWLDTIIDELSSVGYMVALGWHCHLAYGPDYLGPLGFDPWLVGIVAGLIGYGASIYCVYYNIIVAVGSANSQDYVAKFEVVPGASASARKLVPATQKAISLRGEWPGWVKWAAKYGPYIVRRDFISWGVTVLAALALTHVSFALQVGFGIAAAVVVVLDHVRLRALRRSVRRSGHILEAP
jgi:phosphatidylglycerophosphate synthase